MTLRVAAPLGGVLTPLAGVPDPVFAGQLLGAGAAVEPAPEAGPVDVRAPIDGTVVKLHPHAFIVLADSGAAVLVHLGIDTVTLAGEGFTRHVAEGDAVAAGDHIVTFDPAQVRRRGLSAICPVVVVESAPDSITGLPFGSRLRTGDELFRWADGAGG